MAVESTGLTAFSITQKELASANDQVVVPRKDGLYFTGFHICYESGTTTWFYFPYGQNA